MVHPDKCKHPRARDAFEGARSLLLGACRLFPSSLPSPSHAVVGKALNLLTDEKFREELDAHLTRSREAVLRDWHKQAKDDVVLRLRYQGNKEAMEAAFVASDEFAERWKVKTREMMAEFEWRKRCMANRMKTEEARLTAADKEAAAARAAKQKEHRDWDKEDKREERVGGWRAFTAAQQTKKRKGELAGFQGPKLKPEEKKGDTNFGGPKDAKRVQRPDEVSRAW